MELFEISMYPTPQQKRSRRIGGHDTTLSIRRGVPEFEQCARAFLYRVCVQTDEYLKHAVGISRTDPISTVLV